MIPYVTFTSFTLGPVTVYVWGLFVALGILFGTLLTAARAKRRGIDPGGIFNVAFWAVVAGLLGARLWFLLEYGREIGFTLGIVRIQDGGLSAAGAILGGLLGGWWAVRRYRTDVKKVIDVAAPGLLLGEGIGRLGCFAIHDHLGKPTTFPLAVNVLGVPRHEVGLELSLAGFAGAVFLLLWERYGPRTATGALGALALIWYTVTRFLLDFLRAADLPVVDRRYAGLTLAQYAAVLGITVAVVLFFKLRHAGRVGSPT